MKSPVVKPDISSHTIIKTPNNYKKLRAKEKNKSNVTKSSRFSSTKTKFSSKAKSSEKKNSVVSRQITNRASKMLSYTQKSKYLNSQRSEALNPPEFPIRNIKQTNKNIIKKNLIQSMLTNKIASSTNFKIKIKENEPPIPKPSSSINMVTPHAFSKESQNSVRYFKFYNF